jgi:hypothetical protein
MQAQVGMAIVTNDLHTYRVKDDLMRNLIQLLDGSRDFDSLLSELTALVPRDCLADVGVESLRRSLDTLASYGVLSG